MKEETTSIRISEKILEEIREISEKEKRTVHGQVEFILESFLKRQGK